MMKNLLPAACLVMVASRALGAAPTLDDYSQGIELFAPQSLPLVEATMPDSVYQRRDARRSR